MTPHRLHQLRIRLGLTQVEFAERIGVASNTVARWERGEVGMKATTARLIELLCQNTDLTPPTAAKPIITKPAIAKPTITKRGK